MQIVLYIVGCNTHQIDKAHGKEAEHDRQHCEFIGFRHNV